MKCQECHKREATLHFTQVIHGNKLEVHVCEVCAKKKGYMSSPEEAYTLHDLLTGLFNIDSPKVHNQEASLNQVKGVRCPKCDLSFAEFKRIGKFGCATCYETFSDRIDPILRRVHSGNTKHIGKIPKRKGGNLHLKKKVEAYRSELDSLIQNEAFEKAAIVRDKIKELELEIQDKETGDHS
ncbi:MAG TPA: UvrB/UvrC motif-containing protein [Bacillota bacterium]|nr:UvrB/UvrC motif-containing protein [Bacillota bacterium]